MVHVDDQMGRSDDVIGYFTGTRFVNEKGYLISAKIITGWSFLPEDSAN